MATSEDIQEFFHMELLSLLPNQIVWLAVIASLLDQEGLEVDDMPAALTFAEMYALSNVGGLLAITDLLILGKWMKLWPWVNEHAFSWGYSTSGCRD